MNSLDINKFHTPLVFRSRPEAIPGDLRPIWRIGIVILMLHLASRGDKASLAKIHVLNWAIQSKENQNSLLQIIDGKISPDTIIVRIEPSLNRALDYANGEGLIEFISGKNVHLTPQGKVTAHRLMTKDDLLTCEKNFFREIGKSNITEQFVAKLFSEGR